MSSSSELEFAKTFLIRLDHAPVTRSDDYVKDPRKYTFKAPPMLPAYSQGIRYPQASSSEAAGVAGSAAIRNGKESATGSAGTGNGAAGNSGGVSGVMVRVKATAMKPPAQTITVSEGLPARTTSVLDVKKLLAALLPGGGLTASSIRLLYRRKPVPDAKVLADIIDVGATAGLVDLELAYMLTAVSAAATVTATAATKGAEPTSAPCRNTDGNDDPELEVPDAMRLPDAPTPMKLGVTASSEAAEEHQRDVEAEIAVAAAKEFEADPK